MTKIPAITVHLVSSDSEAAYWTSAPGALGEGVLKPFASADAGRLLMEIGAVLSLLPSPPARVVDFGVGTGWTFAFLARRGYAVLGCEVSADAVNAGVQAFRGVGELELRQHDFSQLLPEQAHFDAAVWFDALHHAEDEVAALKVTRAALRPGGICVVCEPGVGHRTSPGSLEAVRKYGVRERDMPARLVRKAALEAGFRSVSLFPHPHEIHRTSYTGYETKGVKGRLLASPPGTALRRTRAILGTNSWGIAVLQA